MGDSNDSAMLAGSVSDVLQPAQCQIQPPPACSGNVQVDPISGVSMVHNGDTRRLLILLDIERPMTGFDRSLLETRQHGGSV